MVSTLSLGGIMTWRGCHVLRLSGWSVRGMLHSALEGSHDRGRNQQLRFVRFVI